MTTDQNTATQAEEVFQSESQKTGLSGKKGLIGLTVLTILYVLSPVDLLPEAILGPLGFVDDAALIAYLIKRIRSRK